jgi:hypothetical protein
MQMHTGGHIYHTRPREELPGTNDENDSLPCRVAFGEFPVVRALPGASFGGTSSGALFALAKKREGKCEAVMLYSTVNYLVVLGR